MFLNFLTISVHYVCKYKNAGLPYEYFTSLPFSYHLEQHMSLIQVRYNI